MNILPGEYEAWLIAAADGLAPEAIANVRAETEGRSWAELGDPAAANRRYRRRFLTESDLRSLQWLGEPPTMKTSHLFLTVVVVLILCLGGYWMFGEGVGNASFLQAGSGLFALLAAQLLFMMIVLPQALRYSHLAITRRWGMMGVAYGYAILWGAAAAAGLITPIVLWAAWRNFDAFLIAFAVFFLLGAIVNNVLILALARRFARTATG